ncbi:TRAP transporter small permease [Moraxella canis]|uniref:TRAP transporter small permease n=1 Tax=Moraxella canis TaxID=90239 RepID=UPI000665953F|nr:TRAP transporter small permease [Moraxella canis]
MSDVFEVAPNQDGSPKDVVGRFLLAWSKLSALCGVIVLMGICLLSTASILGRWLFTKPITGDVELVQIGCAWAISSFLPYTQLKNAHVIVDFFTLKAPKIVRQCLDVLAALILATISLLIAWRTYFGAVGTYQSKSTTMILGLPEWIAHLTITPGFVLLALTALYTVWQFTFNYKN